MTDRLQNPYRKNILLKLKARYKGIWKDLYNIFEIYQCLIQLDEYMVIVLKDNKEYVSLENKFKLFFREFKKNNQIEDLTEFYFLNQLLSIIDKGLYKTDIEDKNSLLKISKNIKFRNALRIIESFIKVIFALNAINYSLRDRLSASGVKYYEFSPTEQNLDVDAKKIIKEQINLYAKIKEYEDLEIEKDIVENKLSLETKKIGEEEYRILKTKEGEVDSVYTRDNRRYRTLEIAIKKNLEKKKISSRYNEVTLVGNKLYYKKELISEVERVVNLEESIKRYNLEIENENKTLKKYETTLENEIEYVSLTEDDVTRVLPIIRVKDENGLVRPVITEGKFKGVYLDQIVSTVGHMLETEYYRLGEREIIEEIGNNEHLLKEPYLIVNEENKLILVLPLKANKESSIVSKFLTRIDKRMFEVELEDFEELRNKLGSLVLSKKAKFLIYSYLGIRDKTRYLKISDSLSEYSVDKVNGMKRGTSDLTLNEKQVLEWIEKQPRGIIGIDTPIEKALIFLALKNPKENYLYVNKNFGALNGEINNISEILPLNIKEVPPNKIDNINKYSKVFLNNIKDEKIIHPNMYYITSTSVGTRIDKIFDLYKYVNNKKYDMQELKDWCSTYSNKILDNYIGLKKDTKEEYLSWLQENAFICPVRDLTLEDAMGLSIQKQTSVVISNIEPQIQLIYERLSNEILELLKKEKPTTELATKLLTLNTLLNNPKKGILKLGYKDIKVKNPKLEKAFEIASTKTRVLFFTEDTDLALENCKYLSNKIPGYHAYIENRTVNIFEYGEMIKQIGVENISNNLRFKTLTSSHKELTSIDLDNYLVGVHLDRGNFSLQTLEDRTKTLGANKKEIFIDSTSLNSTLDTYFQKMTLEQKLQIENLFKDKSQIKVNEDLEGVAISRDLIEAVVSANPSVYNIIQKRILRGKKEPLLYRAYLDPTRFEKAQKSKPHLIANLRREASRINVGLEQVLDLSHATTLYNPITSPSDTDHNVSIEEHGSYKKIIIGQKHPMLGDFSKESENMIITALTIKKNKILSLENKLFTTTECSPKGMGIKAMFSQYKLAVRYLVNEITLFAAGDSSSFDSSGKIQSQSFIGYYVWPKLGYNANIFKNPKISLSQVRELKESLELPKWKELKEWLIRYTEYTPSDNNLYISDVYSCSINNVLVGQKWWKENGVGIELSLSTDSNSISYRIMNKYFKKKCEEEGTTEEEFLVKEFPPFNVDSLSCWNSIIKGTDFLGVNNTNILEVVKKYDKNLILAIIKSANNYPYTSELKEFIYHLYKTKNTIRKKTIFNAIPESVLKSIFKKLYQHGPTQASQDEILKQLLSDAEKSSIKVGSIKENNPLLMEIANDPVLDQEWINISLEVKSKAIKKEIVESDPLLKKKVK